MYKLFYYLLEITVLGTTPKFLKSFFVKYYIKVSYLNDIEIYNLFISKIWFIKTFNSF